MLVSFRVGSAEATLCAATLRQKLQKSNLPPHSVAYRGFPTRVVYLYNDYTDTRPTLPNAYPIPHTRKAGFDPRTFVSSKKTECDCLNGWIKKKVI